MSTSGGVQDESAVERLEEEHLLSRVGTVEPEEDILPVVTRNASASPYPEETTEQARIRHGHSKRLVPRRVILLLFLTLLYTLCLSSTRVASIDIVYRFACHFLDIDQSKCFANPTASSKVASVTSAGSAITGTLSLCVNTYLSSLSDRLGRRPLYITAMCLTALAHLSNWYIVFHMPNPGTIWWLLVPTAIDGLGGGAGLIVSTGVSYISDMVPEASQRTRLVSILDGCIFVSFAMGPMVGSWVMREWNIELLYIGSVIIISSAALLSYLLLKESLSPYHKRRNSEAKRPLRNALKPLKFSHVADPKSKRNAYILVGCALVGTDFAMAFIVVLMIYPKRQFGWSAVESGYLVSTMSLVRTFWFLLGFPLLYTKLGKKLTVHKDGVDLVDINLMRIGLVCAAIGYLLMGWSQRQSQFFASGILDACGSIAFPIYRSALLKYVEPGCYGSFLGAYNFMTSIPNIFGPALFLKLYIWAIEWRPYLPFEVMAVAYAILICVTFLLVPARD